MLLSPVSAKTFFTKKLKTKFIKPKNMPNQTTQTDELTTQQLKVQQELVEELGLSSLPQDKQEELLIKMTEVLLKRIFVETMEKLSDTDRETYEKMVDENTDPEKIGAFLKEKVYDYDGMVEKIILDFKEEMKKVE